jgi:hypothetical protein
MPVALADLVLIVRKLDNVAVVIATATKIFFAEIIRFGRKSTVYGRQGDSVRLRS